MSQKEKKGPLKKDERKKGGEGNLFWRLFASGAFAGERHQPEDLAKDLKLRRSAGSDDRGGRPSGEGCPLTGNELNDQGRSGRLGFAGLLR